MRVWSFCRHLVLVLWVGAIPAARLEALPPAAIAPLPTSETVLVGRFERGPLHLPASVTAEEFVVGFGSNPPWTSPAEVQARQFFAQGGSRLTVLRLPSDVPFETALAGDPESALTGLGAIDLAPDARLVLIPELTLLSDDVFPAAFAHCRSVLESRRLFLILDPPPGLPNAAAAISWVDATVPADAGFCSIYYPYLRTTLEGVTVTNGASGVMAALYAKNDANVGIWRSPSGSGLPLSLSSLWPASPTSAESDLLNTHGLCPIRNFGASGILPWGARTLDRVSGDNRYISVVRTRQWIAASIQRSLAFAASQENAEPLWTGIRQQVENFLEVLYRQGAMVGAKSSEAYFVRCDVSIVSPDDLAAHQVRLLYGLALLRPAEFDVTQLTAPALDPERPAPATPVIWRQPLGGLVLAAPTVPGFRYALEVSDTLEPGSFVETDHRRDGDGTWWSVYVPTDPSTSHALYRIQMKPAW